MDSIEFEWGRVLTITSDDGTEFALHDEIAKLSSASPGINCPTMHSWSPRSDLEFKLVFVAFQLGQGLSLLLARSATLRFHYQKQFYHFMIWLVLRSQRFGHRYLCCGFSSDTQKSPKALNRFFCGRNTMGVPTYLDFLTMREMWDWIGNANSIEQSQWRKSSMNRGIGN